MKNNPLYIVTDISPLSITSSAIVSHSFAVIPNNLSELV